LLITQSRKISGTEDRKREGDAHLSELGLGRELLDRLDEVLVGISIRREDLTQQRDHREGVLSVDAVAIESSEKQRSQLHARERERGRRREETSETKDDEPSEERVGDLSELHASEGSSRLKNSVSLLQNSRDVGAVPDSESDGVEVDGGGGDGGRESLSVSVDEGDLGT